MTSGLHIERRFTADGRDPYDTVEWSRRDSRITNPDGSVVFEMKDAEVPAQWSQVAADIMVSKYFRKAGVLQVDEDGNPVIDEDGKPVTGPERSARQVVKRLASTWRWWGENNDYFASEADAQVFEDELAYMLLHQMAAPNSPQWFNTGLAHQYGITGTPQGFWYVDPETEEAVPSPDSYTRPAPHACFPAGTRITTRGGFLPIEKIEPGDEVLTHEGRYRQVLHTMQRQVDEELVELRIRKLTATPLVATANHPVWAIRKNDPTAAPSWIPAGELRPGDYVVVGADTDSSMIPDQADLAADSSANYVIGDTAITTRNSGHAPTLRRFLEWSDPDVWRLVGRWLGDGTVLHESRDGARSGIGFVFDAADFEGIEDIRGLMDKYFGVDTRAEFANGKRTATLRYLRRPLGQFFGDTFGEGFAGKHLPEAAFELPGTHKLELLTGLYQSDGCEHRVREFRGLNFDFSNRDLAEGVWRIARSLGYAPSITGGTIRPGGTTPHYRVQISATDAPELAARCSVSVPSDTYRSPIRRYGDHVAYRIVSAERNHLYGTVYNFQTEEDESYVAGGVVVHNCFINSVDDDLVNEGGIMDLWVREARLFKMGSGTGSNFSRIRAEGEQLSGGGKSSGLMSFLKVGDRAAGAIKSGGTTRRAAKMVILDVDHPDIEAFINWKAEEEDKVRALVAAGYSSDFNGEAYATVSGQNSNNSVRLSNEFVEAVLEDADWDLTARTDGSVMKTVKARDLWKQIAEAAWKCADPGVQFDTTIQEWHTSPAGGKINATNPCFPGEVRVATDKGLIRFDELVRRSTRGETLEVYSHDATHAERPTETIRISRPSQIVVTGTNEIVKLEFSDGRTLRCTPNHSFFTHNRGWVRADELTGDDRVRLLDRAIDFGMASWEIPVSSDAGHYLQWSSRTYPVQLPVKWTEDFAHYMGWLVGDGSLTEKTAVTVYGTEEEQQSTMIVHRQLLTELNGGVAPKPTKMANGTYQLRITRKAIVRFLEALGVSRSKAADKRVPWSVFEAPKPIVASFLRGLYDADGCVSWGDTTRYVGLASASRLLLEDVQLLLDTFGVHGTIYGGYITQNRQFEYTTVKGEHRTYRGRQVFDLRVMGKAVEHFLDGIGFELSVKGDILEQMVRETTRYRTRDWVKLANRTEDGFETTYNLTEPRNHSYLANGVLSRNCAEYVFLDNTACNLASLNLVQFERADGSFDLDAYRHAIRIWTIVLEISVTMAHFPSKAIAEGSYDYRTLGLGYANLGSLLMRAGIAYDSDLGRSIAGALTAILTGWSYATSAEMAEAVGPFRRFSENRDSMLRVMRNHRRAAYGAAQDQYDGVSHHVVGIDQDLCPPDILAEAHRSWDAAVELGEEHGYRNAQTTVLAPTGCLVGGSLIPTSRGLVRLRSLGDPAGTEWQDLGIEVGTDEGPRTATQFYVNGVEPVVTVDTRRGYRIQGTPTHRIKVVEADGSWVWKRFGDIAGGDKVPLQLDQLVGEPQQVALPPRPEAYWTSDFTTVVPRTMTPELAEFVGYFMGDGSLHAKGIRLCVSREDFDVVDRLSLLGKELFGLGAHVADSGGYTEVAFHSVPLVLWWEACGFAKSPPSENHIGKGYHPHIPDAVLHSNDRSVYAGFLRGLFEADGTVHNGYPSWSTTSLDFSRDVQSLLLALGHVTTRKIDRTGWGDSDLAVLRLLNLSAAGRWADQVGFLGGRKQAGVSRGDHPQAARGDHIPVTRALVDRLAPQNDNLRKTMLLALSRTGSVSRRSAEELLDRTGDGELRHLLGFFYDEVTSAELGDEQYTFDLSVPDNVTYVANGFVSHNTIGLLMDCDTTGVEPDFALVKFKKLAGGGYFKIANQSIAPALERLGYGRDQVQQIIEYVIGTMTLNRAPRINTATLIAKGFTADDIDKIEAVLPGVFELGFAFNQWTLGEETMRRLGFGSDQYNAPGFSVLKALGFTDEDIRLANDHICGRQTIEGAPHLREEHLPVFDTANRNGRYGQRFIHHSGHIKMMAAAQPYISGAISKTINVPNEATVEDIEESYRLSWELGLKAMALYRDGSKASQPLSSKTDDGDSAEDETDGLEDALAEERELVLTGRPTFHAGMFAPGVSPTAAYADMPRPRFLLPARRRGYTQEARVGGHKLFMRTGEYEDGTLGELFLDLAKEGATLRGILSCFAIAVSKGLQYGVPLEEYVDTFTFQTFEPRGMVEGHPNIKMANSIVDYVFRALGVEYLHRDELAQVPPDRSMELPEPRKGLALDAGTQLDLTEAAMESDIDAQVAAAAFVDGEDTPPGGEGVARALELGSGAAVEATAVRTAPVETARSASDVQTAAVQAVLADKMGDAPLCDTCGHITVRNGSCYRCLNCGDSKGCS